MSNIIVTSPYRPFTLPNQFKAVFNGYIYCGTVDAVDPSVSQVQVYLVNEFGDKVPVAQPLRTNAGGFLVYNGQPAKFVTYSNHSLLVRDSLGNQLWYAPDVSIVDPDTAYQFIGAQALEALRRSYSDAGYDVIGTFQAGFTYVNANDVGIDLATGKGYTGPAGVVAPGTNPASGGFVDRSEDLNFVVAKGNIGSAIFQQLIDSATSQGKLLLALCSVDAVSSVTITCKLHPASKCLITPRLVPPALLWPDGEFVVKNSYQGEQTGLEVNNTNLVNGVSGTSLIGYLSDSPESIHKGIVSKRFPINIQCRNYSNRFVDCVGRIGGTGISAVGISSSKEINALVIDGGDYTDNADHNMFIGDTRFPTTIADADYMGLGVSIVNMPRVDQGGIRIDRVNSVKVNAYFEKAGTRYPVAIEIGGNKPSTRLKDYQIGGCVVRNYNYFVKANQRIDGLVIRPNDLYNVDYSGCHLTEIGSGFVYEEQTKTGSSSMVRGQEVHTGIPSGIGGFDPFRSSTIIPHGLVGGVQNHVRDSNNADRPDFVTSSQLIVGTTDRLLRHYRNSKRCKISQGAAVSCVASGNTVTVALADVIKFNGGDLVTVGAVSTYVTSVNYETGVVKTDASVSGSTITQSVVLPTITGASGTIPTEPAAEGSFVFNSSAASPLGWKYISGSWLAV